jgi:hypothetical protein
VHNLSIQHYVLSAVAQGNTTIGDDPVARTKDSLVTNELTHVMTVCISSAGVERNAIIGDDAAARKEDILVRNKLTPVSNVCISSAAGVERYAIIGDDAAARKKDNHVTNELTHAMNVAYNIILMLQAWSATTSLVTTRQRTTRTLLLKQADTCLECLL